MKIVCCSNMPFVKEAFSTLGDVILKDGRRISREDVHDADILAIRSTTRVTCDLLAESSVKFVGTATIGTDHMDIPWLEEKGIKWCYAPGCNANSVSEYITAALLCLAVRHGFRLEGKTLGVIGVGNVGTLVVQKALALGMRVLQNDPPRLEREKSSCFVELEELLAVSDIVTLHVPLEKGGRHPTYGMAGPSFFRSMKPGTIFINSARGDVVDTAALLENLKSGRTAHAVIDTWAGEPSINLDLLTEAGLATPHIAGYSFEGKVTGTLMVYESACMFAGKKPAWSPEDLMPPTVVPLIETDAAGKNDEHVLREIVRKVYDIEADDSALRSGRGKDSAAHFDSLRKNYPVRREFRYTRVKARNAGPGLQQKIAALGFGI